MTSSQSTSPPSTSRQSTDAEAKGFEEALRKLLSTGYDAVSARAAEGGWPAGLWDSLAAMGVPWLGIPEELGGSGGGVAEIVLAVRVAAEYAVPLPVAETALLAGWALAAAGIDVPEGAALACAIEPLRGRELADELVVTGVAENIGWAAHCEYTVGTCELDGSHRVLLLRTADARIESGANIAGETRDRLSFDGARPVAVAVARADLADLLLARGAAARSIAISGATERVLELCVEHAKTRHQFGRPIGAFQAVAHLLARIAGASVAAQGAARLAVQALRDDDVSTAGAAKTVASEAAGTVAELAHQVHGAIGMTREHDLHRYTRRLWAWRDEYGSGRYWARRIGAELTSGADAAGDPWHDLVRAR
jgi:acyl-CoA dehydrogenase